MINYINNERKVGKTWARKTTEQNRASRSLAGRKSFAFGLCLANHQANSYGSIKPTRSEQIEKTLIPRVDRMRP